MPNPNPYAQYATNPYTVYGAPPKVEPYAAEDQSLQREANARADEANRRAAESNERQAREFAATHNPDGSPKPSPKQVQSIPPGAASGIQANLEALRALDASIGALKSRPQSIGPGTGALGDTFTQLNDPAGTDTRSRIGKIGAMTIHDLSGAAVSPTEAPRFQPFVPTVTDTPEVARQKLKNFREALQSQIKEALDYYGPNNGYTPYDTPQAKQFLNGLTPGSGQAGNGGPAKRLNPEQQSEFFNILDSQGPGAADDYMFKITGNRLQDKSAAAKPHSRAVDYSAADAQIKADAEKRGDTGMDAFGEHLANGLTLGSADEIRSVGSALRGSLSGQGSFGDIYNQAQTANQGYQNYLSAEHPYASIGGELAGGAISSLALPVAANPGGVLKQGAGIGSLYGFNSGQDGLGSRVQGAATGAVAGAVLPELMGAGYAGKALAGRNALLAPRAAAAIPPLVDPVTGALNQPLEAMRPAARMAAAKQFNIDLPLDAAGGKTAARLGKGLDIIPGSAGAMEDARRGTEQQVAAGADHVASQFGSARTLNEAGSELQRGVNARNDRAEGVISKAYKAIPIADAAPTSNTNTVATLQQLTGRFQSNPDLAESLKDPKLANYLNAVQKGLSWKDLKDFRSIIGEKIGEFRVGEGSSTSDLRHLYGALSEDMRNTAASMGPRAIRAFERANSLNRENENLVQGALTRILGKDGQLAPEKAAAAVQAMTKGGKSTGDLKTLAQIKGATVKSGAWDEIAATLIRLGGQPANSQGRDFNPQTFVQWYSDMSEPARGMLFKPELRKNLDQFVAVNQRLMKVDGLRNMSQTAGAMTAAATMSTIGTAALSPALGLKVLAANLGAYGAAKVWTNPRFVQWATGYSRAIASGNANAVKSQVGRLQTLAATNPELREPLVALQQKLLSGANDNAMRSAAASQSNSEEQ